MRCNGEKADDKAGVVEHPGGNHSDSPGSLLLSAASATSATTTTSATDFVLPTDYTDVVYISTRDTAATATAATRSANDKCYDPGNFYSGPDFY